MENDYYDLTGKKKKGSGNLVAVIAVILAVVVLVASISLYVSKNGGTGTGNSTISATATATLKPGQTSGAVSGLPTVTPDPRATARPFATLPDGSDTSETVFTQIFKKYSDAVVVVNVYSEGELYGQGSGFVIYDDGYIVTNNHVIADCDAIKVVLHNGVEYDAKLVGTDERTEVALLKIEPKEKLTTVVFGDSDKIVVGQYAIAMGSPLGYECSMNVGYISGTNRIIDSNGYRYRMLQLDVAINSGNSGGPLFNINGEVVGVNTMKEVYTYSSEGSIPVEGIGFAIPSNTVKNIVQQLMTTGKVTRPMLQITGQTAQDEKGNSIGVEVANVTAGGAADKAGIKVGDVIVKFNGATITTMNELTDALDSAIVGDSVEVILQRDGKQMTVNVVLGSS